MASCFICTFKYLKGDILALCIFTAVCVASVLFRGRLDNNMIDIAR